MFTILPLSGSDSPHPPPGSSSPFLQSAHCHFHMSVEDVQARVRELVQREGGGVDCASLLYDKDKIDQLAYNVACLHNGDGAVFRGERGQVRVLAEHSLVLDNFKAPNGGRSRAPAPLLWSVISSTSQYHPWKTRPRSIHR